MQWQLSRCRVPLTLVSLLLDPLPVFELPKRFRTPSARLLLFSLPSPLSPSHFPEIDPESPRISVGIRNHFFFVIYNSMPLQKHFHRSTLPPSTLPLSTPPSPGIAPPLTLLAGWRCRYPLHTADQMSLLVLSVRWCLPPSCLLPPPVRCPLLRMLWSETIEAGGSGGGG